MLWFFIAATALVAADPPNAEDLIRKIAARDKVLIERRKAWDYDIAITREKLDSDDKVDSTEKDEGDDARQCFAELPHASGPARGGGAKQQSREEPFELLKAIDHFTYKVDAEETVNGVPCWRILFTPKPDMPYDNREEKVLNNTAGHIWASKADYSLIRNEGWLVRPVSVAWIFADAAGDAFSLRRDADAEWRLRGRGACSTATSSTCRSSSCTSATRV